MKKRIFCLALALLMLVGMLPVGVFAEGKTEYEKNETGTAVFNDDLLGQVAYITNDPTLGLDASGDYTITVDKALLSQTFYIADSYVGERGYWYKLEPLDGETMPAKMSAKPWVYQNDITSSGYADALIITPPANTCRCCESCTGAEDCECGCGECDYCEPTETDPTTPSTPENPCACCEDCTGAEDCACGCGECQFCEPSTPENPCKCCENCTGAEDCECGCENCQFCEPEEPEYPILTDRETNVAVTLETLPEGVTLEVDPDADVSAQFSDFGIPAANQVFGLDITLTQGGAEYQPGGAYIKVPVDETIPVGTMIGIIHKHGNEVATFMGLTKVLSDHTVEFYTDSFSEFAGFTVDFHYEGVDYSIAGMTSIKLSELFTAMRITEDASQATAVAFSDPSLVEVTNLGGDWLLTSLQAFHTNETLIVTFTNRSIVIDVTDATATAFYHFEKGKVYEVPSKNDDYIVIWVDKDSLPVTVEFKGSYSFDWAKDVEDPDDVDGTHKEDGKEAEISIPQDAPVGYKYSLRNYNLNVAAGNRGRGIVRVIERVTVDYDENGIVTSATSFPDDKTDQVVGDWAMAGTKENVEGEGGRTSDFTISTTTPKAPGYQFEYWTYTNCLGNTAKANPGDTIWLDADSISNKDFVVIKANWTKIPYKITYDEKGGSAVSDQDYNVETNLTLREAPIREGYTFMGWKLSTKTGSWSATTYSAGQNMSNANYGNITLEAQWEVQNAVVYTYTGTIYSGLPAVPETKKYDYNTSVSVEAAPSATGYTFSGWTTSDVTVRNGKFTMPNKTVTFSGYWTPNQYDLTFNYNGGYDSNNPSKKSSSHTVTTGSGNFNDVYWLNPVKDGYTFTGWFTSDGTKVYDVNGHCVEGDYWTAALGAWKGTTDLNLVAGWTEITYNVSFDLNGATSTAILDQTRTWGERYTLPNPTTGHFVITYDHAFKENASDTANKTTTDTVEATFNGWEDQGSIVYEGVTYKYTDFDAPFYGYENREDVLPHESFGNGHYNKYGLLKHYILHGQGEERAAKGSTPGLYPKNMQVSNLSSTAGYTVPLVANWTAVKSVTLPNITRTGYTLTGWVIDDTTYAVGATYTPTANVTAVAQWEQNTEFNVSYAYNTPVPAGAPAVPETSTATAGTSVTVAEAPTLAGYTFSGWSADGITINNGKFTMPNKAVTFTGSWTKNTYTITYNHNDKDTNPATSTVSYDIEDDLTLAQAPTREGYKFSKWNLADGLTAPNGNWAAGDYDASQQMDKGKYGNIELVAQWTDQYRYVLKFDANGGENAPETLTQEWKDENSHQFTWTTNPTREGYDFMGWATESDGEPMASKTSYTMTGKPHDTEEVTLYAVWQRQTGNLKLTFDDDNTKPAIVTVTGQGKSITVVISEDKTIVNLPTGEYTVTAESGRATYTASVDDSNPTVVKGETVTVRVTISGGNSNWFTAFSREKNKCN